jgi:hypothetical protein
MPMRTFLRGPLLVIGLALVLGVGWPGQRCGADPQPLAGTEIDKLIAQLGSESFAVREAATNQLQNREDAIPALRRALKSSDAEVARRAAIILDFFVQREKKRALAHLIALGKEGRVDQAVEKLVRRKQWDNEDACWQVMAELAGRLSDLEKKEFGTVSLRPANPNEELPARDFRRYREKMRPTVLSGSRVTWRELLGHRFVVRAEAIDTDVGKFTSFLASSVTAKIQSLDRSVLFAGDSVEVKGGGQFLIVCDGDVTANGYVRDSLIIARGDVHCTDPVINSRIITSGSVHLERGGKLLDTKVKEKERNPLGFVTFFDPAKIGISVEKADGGLRVQEAAKDKPFTRAGVRAGDLVVALDGAAVTDPEVFRRLLRAKVASEGELAVKLRRGEQTLELRVPCKD